MPPCLNGGFFYSKKQKANVYNVKKIIGGVAMSVIEAKKQIVEEISEKIKDSKSADLVDYCGLNVAEITASRKELRDNNIEYKVYKNTLTRRAVESAEVSELSEQLDEPTAVAFVKDDVVAPARLLHNFSKDHEALEIK